MIADAGADDAPKIAAICNGCGAVGPRVPGTRQVKQSAATAARKIGWTADRYGDLTTCSICAGTVATPPARSPPHG